MCVRFSGITEEDLEDCSTTLRDVQGALLTRFSADTVLIGHSLESDLMALKVRGWWGGGILEWSMEEPDDASCM